ncbi:MAG: Undecaprenyl phosphate-alpha-4-amino-4-deoxy-L-arabinose arabinosyl transferase [candidate division BRC1 bacterium ADurb.BinA292]|nr:MAG: Undecaprenyl phosphate-alpha-4-amino-4-deoxy-L-arabinose arabinosyl transferase [candidate division BRC1 bacterium ADurb.BinA292]
MSQASAAGYLELRDGAATSPLAGDLRRLGLLLAGLTLVRVILAPLFPMLSGEAYYWLWSKHLAPGYFDHPPMVGVMSAIFFGWVEASELAARSGPIILAVLSSLIVYRLARDLFPSGPTAWRGAALFSVTPIFFANGLLTQPDNSLVLFMTLTWLAFWRGCGGAAPDPADARRPERLGWWALAGVAAGCALLSKFMAWVLLPPLWAFLAVSRPHRHLLRSPGPWIAAGLALLVLSPNLIWNAQHEWINYAFQWRRSDLPEAEFEAKNIPLYLFGPLLTLSPLLYFALLRGVVRGWSLWRREHDARWLFLLAAGVPLPLFLGLLSVMVTISLHWPAAGYIPLILLAVGLIHEQGMFGARYVRWLTRLCVGTTLFAVALALTVLALPTSVPWEDLNEDLAEIKAELLGWEAIGGRVRAERQAMEDDSGNRTVIMADNWHLAGPLAFYSAAYGDVFAVVDEDAHNFEIWRQEQGGLKGADAVFVIKKSKPNYKHSKLEKKYDKYHRFLDPLFEDVDAVSSVLVYADDGSTAEYYGVDVSRPRLREFLIFRCYGFKGRLARADDRDDD